MTYIRTYVWMIRRMNATLNKWTNEKMNEWMMMTAYTRHRSRISCWCSHIRDFLAAGRNFRDIWSYTQAEDRLFPVIVCHDQHNRRGRDSWPRVEIRRIRRVEGGRCTGHVYLLQVIHNNTSVNSWIIKKLEVHYTSSMSVHLHSKIHESFLKHTQKNKVCQLNLENLLNKIIDFWHMENLLKIIAKSRAFIKA